MVRLKAPRRRALTHYLRFQFLMVRLKADLKVQQWEIDTDFNSLWFD